MKYIGKSSTGGSEFKVSKKYEVQVWVKGTEDAYGKRTRDGWHVDSIHDEEENAKYEVEHLQSQGQKARVVKR